MEINSETLAWLLEADTVNPAIRYFALHDLLERPADDAAVRAAQAAIMTTGAVPAILDAQYPEGYWVKPGGGYSPKYRGTVWQVIFLGELGADGTAERVRRGCEYVLSHSIASNGAFAARQKPTPSAVIPCLNGNLLCALLRLGYGDEPRVRTALEWQAHAMLADGEVSYLKSATCGPDCACSINEGQPCAWGAAKVLRAFLAVPAAERTELIQKALDRGAQFLLSRDPAVADYPYTERVSSTWFKLGFPLSYWSDVLEVAEVLVDAGYGGDARLENAMQFVLSKQDKDGRWKLDHSLTSKMWINLERRGSPSKWITLRALRMLKRAGRGECGAGSGG